MARRNYSKISKNLAEGSAVEQTLTDEALHADDEAIVEDAKPVIGVVSKCAKLNIRKEPSTSSDVVCEVALNSELMIDLENSTKEWFCVCTAAGSDGFCMKKFVDLR